MTNLTEQWKKGGLPNGWYYVRLIRGEYRIDLYINGKNEWIDCLDDIIDTVVCEVPSYEEWQQLKKWCEEFNALEVAKENTELKSKLQLKETAYDFDTSRLEEENIKLKGLLKSSLSWLPDGSKLRGLRYAQLQDLKRKIIEVLK